MATPTKYTYSIVNDFNGNVRISTLQKKIKDSDIVVELDYINSDISADTVDIFFVDVLSGADQTTLNNIVSGCELLFLKEKKYEEIDRRTTQLIKLGFTFAGKSFSLSTNAQMKMMGINQIRNDSNVTYPIIWNTIDDASTYEIANADVVLSFYLTGVSTYRAHVDSGTSLKNQIRAAATTAEVNAVVDNR